MHKIKNKKILLLLALAILLITSGAQCGTPEGLILGTPKSVTLTYWKVWEESSNIQGLISAYKKKHPYVSIQYKNFTYEEYEHELLNALAEDRGPDIFSINSTWMADYQAKILPLPAEITLKYTVERGTIKKETYTELRAKKALSVSELRNVFPDVVYNNQVIANQIYALPLSIDTLALYYNRDLLNNAGITDPAKTWTDFKDQVVKMTKLNDTNAIIQSGAALGTAKNVNRATDILTVLMQQNGAMMLDNRGTPAFTNTIGDQMPAAQALQFYTSFALPNKEVYCWNDQMANSLTAFMTGKTAYYFGYAYNLPTIKAQAPKLNFGVAALPQINATPINFANYWVESVSKKTKNANEAWDFVSFIATDNTANQKFLKESQKPPALKALIASQADDFLLAPFANQILTSQSWYKGKKALSADEIFSTMIEEGLQGIKDPDKIIKDGYSKIRQVY